jgi:hypothetical protein
MLISNPDFSALNWISKSASSKRNLPSPSLLRGIFGCPSAIATSSPFSSAAFPMSVKIAEENGELVAIAEGQPKIPLNNDGDGKFLFEEADLEIQFNAEKSGFEMSIGGQVFEFSKK